MNRVRDFSKPLYVFLEGFFILLLSSENRRSMSFIQGLICRDCGTRYPAEAIYVCDNCLGPLEASYDRAAQKKSITRDEIAAGPRNLWRYQSLLPVQRDARVDLNDGFTPLLRANRLARA